MNQKELPRVDYTSWLIIETSLSDLCPLSFRSEISSSPFCRFFLSLRWNRSRNTGRRIGRKGEASTRREGFLKDPPTRTLTPGHGSRSRDGDYILFLRVSCQKAGSSRSVQTLGGSSVHLQGRGSSLVYLGAKPSQLIDRNKVLIPGDTFPLTRVMISSCIPLSIIF